MALLSTAYATLSNEMYYGVNDLKGITFGEWDLGTFLKNATSTIQTWGGAFVILIGVIMIIVGIYKIAKGLISHGKGQPPNWVISIALIIVGGALTVGGLDWVMTIAGDQRKTIDELGGAA